MIEPISRGVLDTRLRGYDDLMRRRYPPVIASAAKQSTLFLCGEMDCFAEPVIGRRFAPTRWLAMTWMGPGVELQQPRLLRRDHLAVADLAARDHLGIDPAIGVAEPALQRLRDGEV